MPRASVWLIRLAMLHLLLGSGGGAWLLLAKGGVAPPPAPFLSAHAAIALLGWLVQCTLGVGYWILPKHATGPARGPVWAPWFTLVTLNGGVALAALGTPTIGLVTATLGILVFLATAAPRLKRFGAGR